MTRSLFAFLLGSLLAVALPDAGAREIQRLSASDSGGCTAELAAAKADAEDKKDDAATRGNARPATTTTPVRSQPAVRGGDGAASGARLQAPRWHSFLPGMFR